MQTATCVLADAWWKEKTIWQVQDFLQRTYMPWRYFAEGTDAQNATSSDWFRGTCILLRYHISEFFGDISKETELLVRPFHLKLSARDR